MHFDSATTILDHGENVSLVAGSEPWDGVTIWRTAKRQPTEIGYVMQVYYSTLVNIMNATLIRGMEGILGRFICVWEEIYFVGMEVDSVEER